jgi:arginine exporter protein ArgO
MSRRTTGVFFILISAILYSTRYISAAIFGSNLASTSKDLFNAMLQYVGNGLSAWAVVALIVGIIFLVWAEIETLREKKES